MLIRQLTEHIDILCRSERVPGSPGYHRTQAYLCDQIERMGHNAARQPFRCVPFGSGLNIFAETGPAEGPRTVIGAHYESLPQSGLGADDNASAVAVTLEMLSRAPDDRPLTFVFFDMEENFGTGPVRGSDAFVKNYPKPVRQAVIFDLVGGALLPGFEKVYLQFGPALPGLESPDLEFFHLPMRFLEPMGPWFPRSDYHRFRQKRIPFTFISSGTPWYYHTRSDTPDRLHIGKMASLARCMMETLASDPPAPAPPDWSRFRPFLRKVLDLPEFQDPFLKKLFLKKGNPGHPDMVRLYLKILPRLKKLGPTLWK
ncbi:hypothetical protein DENIS_2359 [Desulfonema ishimotonii]|uniref:Peptidase M28 domain-containing protein n=1 Tax=Desulfonema ishimotonii TaxID=45657 RepID=A0A401FWS9_9BACT|nr:M28 family peptidase [Desulfonema ishimotonii]GBC61399.1 hypothetical protein DENIS_2359 [Desulfonema ishimotonii]